MRAIKIGNREIGAGKSVLMVAEMSGNHNHDIKRALAIIDAAADAGADAIKIQTYTGDTITLNATTPDFMIKWQGKDRSLHDLYQEAHTPWEWHQELFDYAHKRGLICFSSPFDPTAVAFLEKLKAPLYKIASYEVVDVPLLEAVAKTKKPVIMTSGVATLKDLETAMHILRENGTQDIILLQCVGVSVSNYPAKPSEMHLKNIPDFEKRFGVAGGLSDHTLTSESAIAAVALGACVIEKHFTLRRADGGPDCEFSLEPEEFAAMVKAVRIVEQAVAGEPNYERGEGSKVLSKYCKSLFASAPIRKGEVFTKENIRSVRPGAGLLPVYYHHILGKHATQDIPFATPLAWSLIEGGKPSSAD